MGSNEETDLSDPKNWSVEDEVHLLHSTLDNKPVDIVEVRNTTFKNSYGIDKHFQMSIIWSKFTSNSNKNVTSDTLWKKLGSWYNLKSLDEFELLPIDLTEEDFSLPSEAVPDYVMKNLTDDNKKCIDFSGTYKKFISAIETEDDDTDKSQFKLKGSERMKWFESPQVYKSNDRLSKRSYEGKSKLEANDSLNESVETKKVIRQYGKAGEVSSGSILTLNIAPSIYDEYDENTMEIDTLKEDGTDLKRNASSGDAKNDHDRSSKSKRKKANKSETSTAGDSETSENNTSLKNLARSAKAAEHITRARKGSSTSQDVSSGTESEKNVPLSSGDESAKNLKRRSSQRFSSSDTRIETLHKTSEGSNKSDPKRKAPSRR